MSNTIIPPDTEVTHGGVKWRVAAVMSNGGERTYMLIDAYKTVALVPARVLELETPAAPEVIEEQCVWCKGVGQVGIPGAPCNFCSGEGVRRRNVPNR